MAEQQDNPYEILGCDSGATPEELKVAYREASSKAHPDKGGSTEDMQRVNWAWSVLGDPTCRAQWDSGMGETVSRARILREAQTIVADLFAQLASSHQAHSVYDSMRHGLHQIAPDISRHLSQFEATVKRLEKWRGVIRRKDGGKGFIDERLEGMIQEAKSNVARWRTQQLYHAAALELLDELENGWAPEPPPMDSNLISTYSQYVTEVHRLNRFNF